MEILEDTKYYSEAAVFKGSVYRGIKVRVTNEQYPKGKEVTFVGWTSTSQEKKNCIDVCTKWSYL